MLMKLTFDMSISQSLTWSNLVLVKWYIRDLVESNTDFIRYFVDIFINPII